MYQYFKNIWIRTSYVCRLLSTHVQTLFLFLNLFCDYPTENNPVSLKPKWVCGEMKW